MKIAFNEPFKGFGGMYVEEINWSTDGEVTIGGALTRNIAHAEPYEKLILKPPATIIIWNDGTKTVVKCTDGDLYDPEKGVALCFLKKEHPEIYRKILKDAGDAFEEWKEMVFKRVERDLLRDSKEAHHAPSSL